MRFGEEQELYEKVRLVVGADAGAAETIMRAVVDGHRDARLEAEKRASSLEYMWMTALGFSGAAKIGTPGQARHLMAQAMITHLEGKANLAPIEAEALAALKEEYA